MTSVSPDGYVDRPIPTHTLSLRIPELSCILEAPRGEAETYGATPLDRIGTLGTQLDVRTNLQELTYRDLPDGVPLEVIDYVHRTFTKRFDSRGEANEENFITALHYEDYSDILSPSELEIVERARLGHASPAELILVRELIQMKSIELACLTHPYGKNIEMLEDMRVAVWEAVDLFGGEYDETPEDIFKVKESINDDGTLPDLTKGILMTRKRIIGKLPDGTFIKERSSFVLRTDEESGFDQTVVKQLEQALKENPQLDWKAWLVDAGGVDMYADNLLQTNAYSRAIPVSTTIYAFNKETTELVAQKKQRKQQEQRADASARSPEMYEAFYVHRDAHREELARIALESKLIHLAGITYIGPRTDTELVEYLASLDEDVDQ